MSITQNHIVEFLALAASVIFWKDIRNGKLRWLPFFLLFILGVELIGNTLHKSADNNRLYNISIPIEYLFYVFLFYLHGEKLLKRVSLCCICVISITAIVYFINVDIIKFYKYVLRAGHISVLCCYCVYLYEEFQNTKEESLLTNYFFWISSGLFLFNLGDLSYFLFHPYIVANNWDKLQVLFKATNNNLLILLYLSYIISLIVHYKYKKINAREY